MRERSELESHLGGEGSRPSEWVPQPRENEDGGPSHLSLNTSVYEAGGEKASSEGYLEGTVRKVK